MATWGSVARPPTRIIILKMSTITLFERASAATKEGRFLSGLLARVGVPRDATREYCFRLKLRLRYPRRAKLPSIALHGDFSSIPASRLKISFDQAIADIGGPPEFVRDIEGMSGQKYRTFISALVRSWPDARYLEVGSWRGSTAAAALCGNSVGALCIDNWSQFGGPKSEFLANMEKVRSLSPDLDFRFAESDFRNVDYTSIGDFNIFLFDGPHSELDQYEGIMRARPALQNPFVLIVDDWNWPEVRLGTFRAIRDAQFSVASAIEVRTTQDNTHASNKGKSSDWHNGYFIAVLTGTKPPDRMQPRSR
jgi:hypothetical protein